VVREFFVIRQAFDLLDDEERLILLIVRLVDDDGATGAVFRPEVLLLALLVERDDGMRGVEDRLRRAVVLVEDDDAGVGEIVLEVEDVANVGAAPGVNGLVRVADDADVAVVRRPLLGEDVLGDIGVLELVDVNV